METRHHGQVTGYKAALTPAMYQYIFDFQKGLCAHCKLPPAIGETLVGQYDMRHCDILSVVHITCRKSIFPQPLSEYRNNKIPLAGKRDMPIRTEKKMSKFHDPEILRKLYHQKKGQYPVSYHQDPK